LIKQISIDAYRANRSSADSASAAGLYLGSECIVANPEVIRISGNCRIAGKNEAAGAAVAALCDTQGVWAGRDRNIGFTAQSPNC